MIFFNDSLFPKHIKIHVHKKDRQFFLVKPKEFNQSNAEIKIIVDQLNVMYKIRCGDTRKRKLNLLNKYYSVFFPFFESQHRVNTQKTKANWGS